MRRSSERRGSEVGRRRPPHLPALLRVLSVACVVAGVGAIAWVAVTWAWQEPISALQESLDQHALTRTLAARGAPPAGTRAEAARLYRRVSRDGEAMGRIEIPRIGVDEVLVEGTSSSDLAKGPGIYAGDDLPGEPGLVYIAGHRTTHGSPFSHIDELRANDAITIVMPYGAFRYRVTGHRIVRPDDVAVLRSNGHAELVLQTCWPRFSASHRYLVYARPAWKEG